MMEISPSQQPKCKFQPDATTVHNLCSHISAVENCSLLLHSSFVHCFSAKFDSDGTLAPHPHHRKKRRANTVVSTEAEEEDDEQSDSEGERNNRKGDLKVAAL